MTQLLLEGTDIDSIVYSIAQNICTGTTMALLPTYIITGNKNTRVPYKQSLDVIAAYKSIGSSIEYHKLEGLDHCFNNDN